MSTVKAYYDGSTFFPIEALDLPKGKIARPLPSSFTFPNVLRKRFTSVM
jgi:hypothetical protein